MEDAYVYSWNQHPFQELSVCACGHSVCQPGHSFGPAVRPHYILHYILDGSGAYQVNECIYVLTKGQGFLIQPNIMTEYHADIRTPWTYVWLGFEGTRALKTLEQIGVNVRVPVFSADCGEQLLHVVKEMLTHRGDTPDQFFLAQSDMFRFFAILNRGIAQQQGMWNPERQQQHYYVNAAIQFIREHYAEDIKVKDIADHVGISRTYLSMLFRELQNMTPNEYLTYFRLTRAREQLVITDLPIGTIALLCGYRDPLVFSKAFKQQNKMTPSQYRKTNREGKHIRLKDIPPQ